MQSRTPRLTASFAPARGRPFGVRVSERARAGKPTGFAQVLVVALLVIATSGCRSTTGGEGEPPAVGVVETLNTLRLSSNGGEDALATKVYVELGIEPKILGEFRVLGRGGNGRPAQDALVQLSITWKDFVGVSPTSFGGRKSRPTVFGDDGDARFGSPLRRTFELTLDPPPPKVLARRVEVSARFHPLDIVGEEVRSAGARLDFSRASLETLARAPGGVLAEWFEEGGERDPEELFLRAAATPPDRRLEVVEWLIGSLASLKGAEREAGYGALHFLTGVTNGRSVYAWEAWLMKQSWSDPAEVGG